MMRGGVRACVVLSIVLLAAVVPPTTTSAAPPPDFVETTVFSGLTNPTAIEFAPDGRVFIGEKSGLIKVFDGLSDTAPTTFADLRTNVHNFWDRGLLGLALDPNWTTTPTVYVLYTHDAAIGGTAPRWGTAGATGDACPTPQGATGDGCVVSGRLSKLVVEAGGTGGPEQVLIEDWCQQYPSHSIGSLDFGADGALYVTAGEGASFNFADYGQDGNPLNPCGDPPAGVGGAQTPPTAEGGALRSQDLRTTADAMGLDGTVLRVNPQTGAGLPDNPLAGSADANARRVIATGLRNPFRMTVRPGTSEVWLGDVGWNSFEEINRIPSPTDATVENFGWPCYEGPGRQAGYDGLNLTLCKNLYATPDADTPPFYSYSHGEQVVPGEPCPSGSSSSAGVAFYEGGAYPDSYDGALFFADYSRDCIWVMFEQGGQPDPATRTTFVGNAADPVDLEIGPNGDLFYVDFTGSIRRIEYTAEPPPPEEQYLSDLTPSAATNGLGPYEIDTSNGGAAAGDGSTITLNGTTYAKGLGVHATSSLTFDLSGMNCTRFNSDVGIDDEVGTRGSVTFTVYSDTTSLYSSGLMRGSTATRSIDIDITGVDALTLNVTTSDGLNNDHGDWADAKVTCSGEPPPGAPTATIESPPLGTTWKVDDEINFTGSATDPEEGRLPSSALSWEVLIQHCPSLCHEHVLQTFDGVASGSFRAPDHEYPSYLELRLTATDSGGNSDTATMELQPQTVVLTFATSPQGGQVTVGSSAGTAPFTRTVIVGSTNSISVASPQVIDNNEYVFESWSDGGSRAHDIVAPASATTYTATFVPSAPTPPVISDVNVTNITRTRATINWTTDEPATSQVEYGTTSSYGSTTTLNTTLVTTHSQRIRNLRRNTLYHFRVLSRDAAGSLATSGDVTFQTSR
jgi:glucose/arabinose dehydrogenase